MRIRSDNHGLLHVIRHSHPPTKVSTQSGTRGLSTRLYGGWSDVETSHARWSPSSRDRLTPTGPEENPTALAGPCDASNCVWTLSTPSRNSVGTPDCTPRTLGSEIQRCSRFFLQIPQPWHCDLPPLFSVYNATCLWCESFPSSWSLPSRPILHRPGSLGCRRTRAPKVQHNGANEQM
jgi:hypothetical protein